MVPSGYCSCGRKLGCFLAKKNLFTLRLKRAYRCRLCDTVPTTDHNTQLANIHPKTRSSVSVLQDKSFFDLVS